MLMGPTYATVMVIDLATENDTKTPDLREPNLANPNLSWKSGSLERAGELGGQQALNVRSLAAI